ncbi:MAG: SusC/RagA family TonB-linked outer membrane protein [Prevotellaceae bacterium]|jgi:TonB-linked SusC/RagA family outer membrane protein|nr:SusC/RagA family TonB-linked outer membrane protein [Prevotellaceae bacterium]
MERMFLVAAVGLFLGYGLKAQTGIPVSGVVKDVQDEPVPGVTVTVKGSNVGTLTDIGGKFQLNVPADGTLVFSLLGFATQEVVVGAKSVIDVVLEDDEQLLEEVIFVGYATGSQKTISGAVQKIGRDDMNAGVVVNPLQAIKGKAAGVNISKAGGDPTAGASIRVRGTTSLTGGNDPLVIIDGVFGDLALLNAIAPSDIESITVLKDASEAAQYGSRGASGVLVVTTVKGKSGGEAKSLNYDGSFGVESIYKNLKMLSAAQYREAVKNGGYRNALDKGGSTNFFEEMERMGYTQSHNVSFGGSMSDRSGYRASVGIVDQQGIIRNNSMQNATVKLDAAQTMFDGRLLADLGMFGSQVNKRYLNDYFKTFYSAAAFNPTFPAVANPDGTWPEDPNANEVQNPVGRLEIDDREVFTNVNVHAKLTWTIVEDLKLSAFGSYTYGVKENMLYVPKNIKAGQGDMGHATRNDHKSKSVMGNLMLNYKKKIDRHAMDFLGLAEVQRYENTGFGAGARGFDDADFYGYNNLKGGANVKYGDVSSYYNAYQLASFMGRFNYVYDRKYIATVNLRTDASSKLGKNNKWGFFPSASLAWDIGEEAFMKSVRAVNNLKLRAGYGMTGNQDAIESYKSLALYGPSDDNKLSSIDGRPAVSPVIRGNANPDLRWETKQTFDAGLDIGLWDDRLTATIDVYTSKTVDLLYNYDVPVPPFIFPTMLANLGAMRNNGVEVSLGAVPVRKKDTELTVSANFAWQQNKLLSLSGTYMGENLSAREYMSLASVSGAGLIGGHNNVTYNIVGQPLGVFYLPKSNGLIDNGFGQYNYNVLDIDGTQGVDLADGKDRYVAGQSMPKVYLGFNIGFRYKRFDAQVQLNGAFGHKIYNGTALTYMNMNPFPTYNVMEGAPEKNIRDTKLTDYWLERGDYLQVEYLSVGYNINTDKLRLVKKIRLSASVNNIFNFTNYSGLSPLINSAVVNDNLGLDDKRFYPLSRTYSIGLSVNF